MRREVRILVVEDEDTVQSILAAFLKRFTDEMNLQASLKTMGDAVQGLFELTAAGDRYDAILLDVRLPNLSGDEIYHSLEHVNPDLLGRVLFVTGYPADLTERWPDRKLNVLEKPFRYKAFADRLGGILGTS